MNFFISFKSSELNFISNKLEGYDNRVDGDSYHSAEMRYGLKIPGSGDPQILLSPSDSLTKISNLINIKKEVQI